MKLRTFLFDTRAPAATILVRLMVGAVFLSEGIQKFLFPETLGTGRFAQIGIPVPWFSAPFVGVVEIGCGILILAGLLTRPAVIPLLTDMLVALATTKVPVLLQKGFWAAAHEARVDLSMLLGLLFLLIAGGGDYSLDGWITGRRGGSRQGLPPGHGISPPPVDR